ncbi:MAG: peptidoglycan-binding domain-containing protein [Arhodomonas sp.]|nr:peptidoglycan-binding domain-containing protein [Arhodomonas sp.]
MEEQDQAVQQFIRWLEGYASGINRLQEKTFDVSPVLDSAVLGNMVLGVCRNSPDLAFETAAARLFNTLKPVRERESSELIEIEQGDAKVALRSATLRRVQRRLRELGHYSGGIDGIYGGGTRQAIRAFQEAEGLPTSGLPDANTVLRLLLSDAQ